MSDPIVRTESEEAPIPILGESTFDRNGPVERTWKNAPSIVRDVRMLTIFGIFLNCLWILMGSMVVFAPSTRTKPAGFNSGSVLFLVLVSISLVVLQSWLIRGLRLGTKVVWTIELVLAIIGLPAYALIRIYILYKWFQPETKRWFGTGS